MSFTSRSLLPIVIWSLLAAFTAEARAANPVSYSLTEAVQKESLRLETTSNGRDELRAVMTNSATEEIRITIPAAMVFQNEVGDRIIVLRSAETTLPANGTAEAEIPVAALSSRNAFGAQPYVPAAATEPKLTGFLSFLATNNDVPRATSQLVVLALLENVTFAQWQQFAAAQQGAEAKAAAGDVVQAIDALGLLRAVAPGKTFALASDNQLKLRALRNPVTRAKAVQLYGLDSPDGAAPPPADAPSLKQLLHSQPGDSCPVCRMREKAGRGAGDF